jgi:hypothetical protein
MRWTGVQNRPSGRHTGRLVRNGFVATYAEHAVLGPCCGSRATHRSISFKQFSDEWG